MTNGGPGKNATKKMARKEAKEEVKKYLAKQSHSAKAPGIAAKVSGAAITPKKTHRVNWYLLTLLNPDGWREYLDHCRGIPDLYSHLSHIFMTRTFVEVDPSRFSGSGNCIIIVKPELTQHISVTSDDTASQGFNLIHISSTGTSDDLRPQTDGDFLSQMNSLAGEVYQLKIGVSSFVAGNVINYPLIQPGECDNNGCRVLQMAESTRGLFSHQNFKYDITGSTSNTVTFYAQLARAAAAGDAFTFGVKVWDGATIATRSVAVALSAGDTVATGTATLTAPDVEILGYSFESSGTGNLLIKDIRVQGLLRPATAETNLSVIPAEKASEHLVNFTAIRPVAGYAYLKYRGDTTQNGSVAGALVDNLVQPSQVSMLGYSQVASFAGSYEGPIQSGMYGIYCPMNMQDINFDKTSSVPANRPYLSYGIDAPTTGAQNLRLEVLFVWEGLTQDNVFSPQPGTVDIMAMDHAFHSLAHFNKVMCNSLHLSKIASFLQRGGRKIGKFLGSDAGNVLTSAASELIPLPGVKTGLSMARAALHSMS
jgi:hypothetical protein